MTPRARDGRPIRPAGAQLPRRADYPQVTTALLEEITAHTARGHALCPLDYVHLVSARGADTALAQSAFRALRHRGFVHVGEPPGLYVTLTGQPIAAAPRRPDVETTLAGRRRSRCAQ